MPMALIVKGIYVSWSNDPPNTKIKDWNVTELKVCGPSQLFPRQKQIVRHLLITFTPPRLTPIDDTSTSPSSRISGRCSIRGYRRTSLRWSSRQM